MGIAWHFFVFTIIFHNKKERVICLSSPHCAFQDGIHQTVIFKQISIRVSVYVRNDLFRATYIL
jgi:hypothetical protein